MLRVFRIILAIVIFGICTGFPGIVFASSGTDSSDKVPLTLVKQWETTSGNDVAVDAHGNVYVADYINHAVKVIYHNRTVHTVAGGFDYPYSVALASNGDIYVGDAGNFSIKYSGAIKVIRIDGTVTTLKTGYDRPYVAVDSRDNAYVAAEDKNYRNVIEVFYKNGTSRVLSPINYLPLGIAVDRDDRVYVVSSGNILVIYTNGTTRDIQLNFPTIGIAVDSSGNIYTGSSNYYFSSTDDVFVRKIYTNGSVQVLGEGFKDIHGIDVDSSGNIYVAAGHIKEICANGTTRFLCAELLSPNDCAVDQRGNIYVTDYASQSVRKISNDGNIKTLSNKFSSPGSITVDSYGNLYVVDRKYLVDIEVLYANGSARTLCSGLFHGIAVDSKGKIYATDGSQTLMEISSNGVTKKIIEQYYNRNFLYGVTADPQGNLYVADAWGWNGVKKIDPKGKITVLGNAGEFYNSKDVCIDSSGVVYVADSGHDLVKMITKKGVIKTFDHTFNHPRSVAVDNHGHLYVIDDNGLMEFSL